MKEMYSKEEFVEAIRILEEADKWDNKLYDAGIQLHDDAPLYQMLSEYVHMLEHMFEVEDEWISWWAWETDFGKDEKMNTVYSHEDDVEIKTVLDSAESLYDFLIENMEIQNGRNES